MASCKFSALSLNNHTAIGESCKEQAAATKEGVNELLYRDNHTVTGESCKEQVAAAKEGVNEFLYRGVLDQWLVQACTSKVDSFFSIPRLFCTSKNKLIAE